MDEFDEVIGALAERDGVTVGGGRGFGANALKVDGRIFAMSDDAGLVLKLPRDRVAALVASGAGLPFDAGKGRPMNSWVFRPMMMWWPIVRDLKSFNSAGRCQGTAPSRPITRLRDMATIREIMAIRPRREL